MNTTRRKKSWPQAALSASVLAPCNVHLFGLFRVSSESQMLCDKIRNHPHSADANHFDDFAIVISRGETMPVKPSSKLRNTRVRVALPFRGSHLRSAYRRSGIAPTSDVRAIRLLIPSPQFFAPNAVHLRHTLTLSAELRTCQTRRKSKHLKTAGK